MPKSKHRKKKKVSQQAKKIAIQKPTAMPTNSPTPQPHTQTQALEPLPFRVGKEAVQTGNYNSSIARCHKIIEEIEAITKRRTIAYFAAQVDSPLAYINDNDPFQIENILRLPDDYDGLDLILNSGGGYALSAERIINVCKTYVVKNNLKEFRVIVPRAAKSAATIVALGADKTLLCDNAELGPVDPQLVLVGDNGRPFTKPAYLLQQAVDQLLKDSESADPSQVQKYTIFLQQYNYDIYTTAKNELGLSQNIVEKIFNSKKDKFPTLTKEAFEIFEDPKKTFAHGRLIGIDDLTENALYKNSIIDDMRTHFSNDKDDKKTEQEIEKLSELYWELYVRNNLLLDDSANPIVKTLQTKDHYWPSLNENWKSPTAPQTP